ncbi:metallophosphoesterase family protein [Neobacillus niacini]|uniref:metallophosphoesterase family protein n=1 Tax=Neobacillus niacini TaxID=86668 RepID=UPI00203D7F20|nr:metallophosphoesterase family protein [Neobacillus niacini]MCM3689712.1 serine/threonine protein phosphatase [Neobacillus niacini]
MKRKFAISDIHGQYKPMVTLLDAVKFNPKVDQLVLIGDLIDRGPDSVEVIKFVKKLQEQNPENIFVVLGNHEIMMRQYIFGGKSHTWLLYGGLKVIEEMKTHFNGITERNEHLVWLANLPLIHSDEEFFYVHAGIDLSRDITKQHEDCTFMDIADMYTVNKDALKIAIGNRLMIHGHTTYSCVYRAGNFISCDTGASVLPEGKLSLINLTNQTYYCNNTYSTEVLTFPIHEMNIRERLNVRE